MSQWITENKLIEYRPQYHMSVLITPLKTVFLAQIYQVKIIR